MSATTSLPSEADSVIVGAGPTGLVTACLLLQRGAQAVILDSEPAPARTSRASVIHLRTLEVLERLGLAEAVIERGLPINEMTLYEKTTLLSKLVFDGLHDRYRHAVAIPQTETERLLTEKLHDLGGKIYRDCTVTEVLSNDASGVQLRIKCKSMPELHIITAKYVIAADGLHSKVRESVDIPFDGSQYDLSFATADVYMDAAGWPHQDLRSSVNLYLDPAGFLLTVPFPSPQDNLWRIIATVESAPKEPDRAFLDDVVRSRGPPAPQLNQPIVTEVVWSSHFRISHKLARQYRQGRVFLAGDAAHTHSPAGGQGMNTGMQDAECLATVLVEALALESEVSSKDIAAHTQHKVEEALARYERTRRPIAQRVVALTHRLTVVTTMTNPWLCWVRNRLMWLVPKLVPGLAGYMSWRVSELEH
jgi:2-polyprenyl-6-methoxyphenol hydroxylase-like FAD-dependent oxidoreductase